MSSHSHSHSLRLTAAGAANLEETGMSTPDVFSDVGCIRTGAKTAGQLLEDCLDGADDDRVQGWRDYVAAVVAAASDD